MGHGEDHIHMARLGVVAALAVAAMLCVAVHAEVFFQEDFTDGWEDRWVKSKFKSGDEGPWELSAGKFYGDADNKGNSVQLLSRSWHRTCAQCIARDSEAG